MLVSLDILEIGRVCVFCLYAIATVGVIVGVYWEHEDFEIAKRKRGWLLLLVSLGTETFLTVALFEIDSEISHRQQTTIQQLVAHRRLGLIQKEELAAVAKKFPSQNFLTITALDAESWDFVMEIAAELKRNGWNWMPCDGPLPKLRPTDDRPISCWTVLDHVEVDGAQAKAEIVHSLAKALKNPSVMGMDDVRVVINEAFPTIAIMVGTKR